MGTGGFLDDDWLKRQQDYWHRWLELAARQTEAGDSPPNPWENAFDQWWKGQLPGAPELIQELLEKSLAQAKELFQMAELFAQSEQMEAAEAFDWRSAIQQTFGDLRRIIAGITGSMNPLPEGMLDEAVVERSGDYLERLFALPGLGLGHRSRARQRELIRRLLAYQQAHQAYERFIMDIGERALSRLQLRLEAMAAENRRVESARALYDLWVSVCESVYAEWVMTADYVELYGTLINSQMAVKQQMGMMLDETLTALGMPTASDFRALERRAYEDRQAIKSLRAELQILREASPKKPPGRKKPAPRKRAVTRKTQHAPD